MRKNLVVGNWKMHGSRAANSVLLAGLKEAGPWSADVAVCVPFPYLTETALALTGQQVVFGAQDCSAHEQGAFTGEVSSAMLSDLGCRYVEENLISHFGLFCLKGCLPRRPFLLVRPAGRTPRK